MRILAAIAAVPGRINKKVPQAYQTQKSETLAREYQTESSLEQLASQGRMQ